jgi:hypothetical protein
MHDAAHTGDTIVQHRARIIEMDKIRRTEFEVLAQSLSRRKLKAIA